MPPARLDNAVAVFSRDASTGALTYAQVLKDGEAGVGSARVRSPCRHDGLDVYVAAGTDDAISIFSRDRRPVSSPSMVCSKQLGTRVLTGRSRSS
jgi:hypothetical protein